MRFNEVRHRLKNIMAVTQALAKQTSVDGRSAEEYRDVLERLDQQTQAKKDTTIFFRADKHVEYAELMAVMNELRGAGYLKIGLVGLETVAPR